MRCVSVVTAALAALLFSLPPFPSGASAADEQPRLLKTVILSRHGVRPPTQTPKVLSDWSRSPWPVWDTPPGHLTGRGAALLRAEWAGMRSTLAFGGLLPASECPDQGRIFLYADNEERTLASAEAMAEGLAPGCDLKVLSRPKGTDPVFHPVRGGFMPSPELSPKQKKDLAEKLSIIQTDLGSRMEELGALLGPVSSALCPPGNASCTLTDIPSSLSFPKQGSRKSVSLQGGLAMASTCAEILLLESLQWPQKAQAIAATAPVVAPLSPGTPVEQKARQIILAPRSDRPDTVSLPPLPLRQRAPFVPAQGDVMVNPATALRLLPVHTRVQNALQRFPAIASQEGMPLLLLMAESLAGSSPLKGANEARLVVYAGHDTNIVNIAGLLSLHWNNVPFPMDSTPPGSMLALSLWEGSGEPLVQASFLCQTPAAFLSTDENVMREASLRHVPLILPGSLTETPAGPGLPLSVFLSSVRAMAGKELMARLPELFVSAP